MTVSLVLKMRVTLSVMIEDISGGVTVSLTGRYSKQFMKLAISKWKTVKIAHLSTKAGQYSIPPDTHQLDRNVVFGNNVGWWQLNQNVPNAADWAR